MVRVTIEYYVADIEGLPFRPLDDIVRDIEREIWGSPLFSEASDYRITVADETECSIIDSQKEKEEWQEKRKEEIC